MTELLRRFCRDERMVKNLRMKMSVLGVTTVEDLRWMTIEEFRESKIFGPLYLGAIKNMLVCIRGE